MSIFRKYADVSNDCVKQNSQSSDKAWTDFNETVSYMCTAEGQSGDLSSVCIYYANLINIDAEFKYGNL